MNRNIHTGWYLEPTKVIYTIPQHKTLPSKIKQFLSIKQSTKQSKLANTLQEHCMVIELITQLWVLFNNQKGKWLTGENIYGRDVYLSRIFHFLTAWTTLQDDTLNWNDGVHTWMLRFFFRYKLSLCFLEALLSISKLILHVNNQKKKSTVKPMKWNSTGNRSFTVSAESEIWQGLPMKSIMKGAEP